MSRRNELANEMREKELAALEAEEAQAAFELQEQQLTEEYDLYHTPDKENRYPATPWELISTNVGDTKSFQKKDGTTVNLIFKGKYWVRDNGLKKLNDTLDDLDSVLPQ